MRRNPYDAPTFYRTDSCRNCTRWRAFIWSRRAVARPVGVRPRMMPNNRSRRLRNPPILASIACALPDQSTYFRVHLGRLSSKKSARLRLDDRKDVDRLDKIFVLDILIGRERPLVCPLSQVGNSGFESGTHSQANDRARDIGCQCVGHRFQELIKVASRRHALIVSGVALTIQMTAAEQSGTSK